MAIRISSVKITSMQNDNIQGTMYKDKRYYN